MCAVFLEYYRQWLIISHSISNMVVYNNFIAEWPYYIVPSHTYPVYLKHLIKSDLNPWLVGLA